MVDNVRDRIEIGTEVFVGSVRGRGGHGAYMIVDKINKKTFKATERERSYKPGTKWTVHFESAFAIVHYDGISPINGKSGCMRLEWFNDY